MGIPDIRAVVADWLRDHALGEVDGDALMALASRSVALPVAENKLAAILLQEHGLDRIEPERHLSQIAQWFDRGDIADWNTCDWLCVRVLGPLIVAHGEPVARQVAEWVQARAYGGDGRPAWHSSPWRPTGRRTSRGSPLWC